MLSSFRNVTPFRKAAAPAACAVILLTTLVLLPSPASAQTVTVGMPDNRSSNGYPFGPGNGINAYVAGSEYQELYSSAAFAGAGSPLTIRDIAFASAPNSTPTTAVYNLTLRLSTTSAALGSLGTDFAANEGADATVVFSGPLTATIEATGLFDLVFPTSPFLYNPTQGNLLLDVVLNQTTSSPVGDSFTFLADNSGQTNRVFQSGGTGAATFGTEGLYTQFQVSPAVPEVSTTVSFGLLLALGLGGMIVAAKRKKHSA